MCAAALEGGVLTENGLLLNGVGDVGFLRLRAYDLNIKYTAPSRHRLAQRKSSLRGWFMYRIEKGAKTASVMTS